MMLQLNPPIPVKVVSKGNAEGRALGWIDVHTEISLMWIVMLEGSGEVWVVKNEDIRTHKNFSMDYS